MIDIDKYEGHTPGPWMMGEYKGRPSIHAGDETFVRSIARGLNPSQTADHALLLDAPLLLAEVKRLHNHIRRCVIGQNQRCTKSTMMLGENYMKKYMKEMKKND